MMAFKLKADPRWHRGTRFNPRLLSVLLAISSLFFILCLAVMGQQFHEDDGSGQLADVSDEPGFESGAQFKFVLYSLLAPTFYIIYFSFSIYLHHRGQASPIWFTLFPLGVMTGAIWQVMFWMGRDIVVEKWRDDGPSATLMGLIYTRMVLGVLILSGLLAQFIWSAVAWGWWKKAERLERERAGCGKEERVELGNLDSEAVAVVK